jgi:hypothetical protein
MYEIIIYFILTYGLKKSVVDTNLYIITQDNWLVILALYVDDAILINSDVARLLKQISKVSWQRSLL